MAGDAKPIWAALYRSVFHWWD